MMFRKFLTDELLFKDFPQFLETKFWSHHLRVSYSLFLDQENNKSKELRELRPSGHGALTITRTWSGTRVFVCLFVLL